MVVKHQSLPKVAMQASDQPLREPVRRRSAEDNIRLSRSLLPQWRLLAVAFVALLVGGAADILER